MFNSKLSVYELLGRVNLTNMKTVKDVVAQYGGLQAKVVLTENWDVMSWSSAERQLTISVNVVNRSRETALGEDTYNAIHGGQLYF